MKKVLILEDEVNIRSFVVINLRRAGYDVIEAGTGQDALDRLAENPDIGVAILDIMLPDIDGFEVCRRIRRQTSKPSMSGSIISRIATPMSGFSASRSSASWPVPASITS